MDRLTERVPVGRTGHPDEIADAATYLCANAAKRLGSPYGQWRPSSGWPS
jgi:NAD(P)-dependent dehydrogenase (short-subunit alcohol dehydrogenase family)